jgi:enoyl-CoA hydratase/carnithine racemase
MITKLAGLERPLVITGSDHCFSVGADLHEINQLNFSSGIEFAHLGQSLMETVERFPAPVFAAISGFCFGGGLDLALACHRRFAASTAQFGHRGAALGFMTGWGGTQRLSRIVGRARTLELLATAERISAERALQIGLVEKISNDPVGEAVSLACRLTT